MKSPESKAICAALALTAVALAAAFFFRADAAGQLRAIRACRAGLASLAPEMARLGALRDAESILSSGGSLPESVPLPVSLPAPAEMSREVRETPDGLHAAIFDLQWRVTPKTALELLATLANLGPYWHLASFSMRPADGLEFVEAEVVGAPSAAQ